MLSKPIWLFSKVGQRSHIGALRRKGTIYCNTVEHFQGTKDGNLRGDPLENCTSFYQPDQVKLTVNGHSLTEIVGPIIVYNSPDDVFQTTHLFCMTCIYEGMKMRDDGKIFDERVRDFGEMMLIIKPAAFMTKIENAVTKLQQQGIDIDLYRGMVEYVPSEKNQHQMNVFRKTDTYAWQSEFRLALRVGNWVGGAFPLQIGNIADISYVVPIKKFINKFEELADGRVDLNFS